MQKVLVRSGRSSPKIRQSAEIGRASTKDGWQRKTRFNQVRKGRNGMSVPRNIRSLRSSEIGKNTSYFPSTEELLCGIQSLDSLTHSELACCYHLHPCAV
ncbi:hypothetical protein BCR43DRAFT_113859 [Syncephalastrum racemosum]|uniref:Uncharacterized protein n=1 Tax=Syncephalastrum racemosum TaxID=13706 RepID=A0A1X2H0A4_SYNRA|nr:hypothetical protein BCR43DRAFT_113859 [Syncephalastrum racemosum]